MKNEIWKPIAGYEGVYEVSSCGRVKSNDHIASNGRMQAGRMMSMTKCSQGYTRVSLRKNGSYVVRKGHVLVLEAFVGPRPDGLVGCHNNDIRDDNRLENLRWDTQKANKADSLRNGGFARGNLMQCRGEGHSRALVCQRDVDRIRESVFYGARRKDIARIYGVSIGAVDGIVSGKNWKYSFRPEFFSTADA